MKTQIEVQAQVRLGLRLIVLATTLWGTVGVVVQAIYQLSAANPLSVAFFRLALAVPVLALVCWLVLGRSMFQIARRHLMLMLLIGIMMALSQSCYFAAIAQIGVAAATLITLCTAPVWVALLASALLHERLSRGVLLTAGLAVIGTALLVGIEPQAVTAQANPALGVLLALGSGLTYALVVLTSRALAGRYHPLQSLTVSIGVGAATLLLFTLATTGLVIQYSPLGWTLLLYLGLVPTALAYLLYFSGICHTTATVASIAALLEPLTATLLASWLLGEQLGSLGLLGSVLLLSAIGLLYLESWQRGQQDSA
ncbi:DMT family transporter [Leptolyngbya sp. FACHB-261]|uniref:DMT family transporter n=1 Tax=Leptolyngbya sp. FACHB-261 TaxID=2692806 RepID=UPI001682607F|nr:EamA family transporter [Leptolyngbya sp. FACHB-261]MBD2100809.1 EamA family transporter [Leptolyngbya sp. FACHB-261]